MAETRPTNRPPPVIYKPREATGGVAFEVIPSTRLSVGSNIVSVGQVLREKLAATARKASTSQMTHAALDSLIPVIYGTQRIGGLLCNALVNTTNSTWVFWIIWCEGQIEEYIARNNVLQVCMNNEPMPTGAILDNYGGYPDGQISTRLQNAFAANKVYGFVEALPGIAYSVITLPFAAVTQEPNFTAEIKGQRNIYDPRNGTYAWSDNPSLILADYLTNTTWGAGLTVDWNSVATAANANDVLLGTTPNTEKSRRANFVVDREATIAEWIETMRAAASVFLVDTSDPTAAIRFVPDVDATPVASYVHDLGQIIEISDPTLQTASNLPTVIEVQYTDTSQLPWATVSSTPATRDNAPFRKSVIQMPWITSRSQADREAIERLNKLWLRSFTVRMHVFDDGLQRVPGDIVTVTYPEVGISALPMRVLDCVASEDGWWLTLERHDLGAYATTVQGEPSIPNTTLPSPNSPPQASGLAVAEDVYQLQTGLWASRLIATWADAGIEFPFVAGYVVTILQANTVVEGPAVVPANTLRYVTRALKEGLDYLVRVQVQSATRVLGTAAEVSFSNLGKIRLQPPSNVPSLTGFEVGGEVRLQWIPSSLAVDFDVTAHEIRYSSTAGAWSSATLLDRVPMPSVRYVTRTVPAGTWRFWIKALDSVRTTAYPNGQESPSATYCDITVTSDAAAFVAGAYNFTTPLLFNMTAHGSPTFWVTDFADTWASLFPNAMSTYTQPLYTYHTAGSSLIATEVADLGLSLTGDWYLGMTYSNLSGTATSYIDLSDGPDAGKTITGATNATPIVITANTHGYATGDEVQIAGVLGNTAANGIRLVTVVDANSFSIQDLNGTNIAGNATWQSGGTQTSSRWIWGRYQSATIKATARFARARLGTTGTMLVTALGSVRCNIVARQEGGIATTSGVAGTPTTITFANRYNKAVSVIATAQAIGGATPLFAVYDAVEVDGSRGMASGQALRFDGTGDYATINDSVPLSPTSAITIEFMLNTAFTGLNEYRAPIVKWNWGTSSSWAVQVHQQTGSIFFNIATSANDTSGNNYVIANAGAVGGSRWARASCVFDGGLTGNLNRAKIYIDGALASTNSLGTIPASLIDSSAAVELGRFTNFPEGGTNGRSYIGLIDDVRIWNVARTQAQIAANLTTALLGNESGLVGYWKLDGNANDSTSNANNGTVTNARYRPLNGMDLYTFDSAGAQTAGTVSWNFSGV